MHNIYNEAAAVARSRTHLGIRTTVVLDSHAESWDDCDLLCVCNFVPTSIDSNSVLHLVRIASP